MESWREMIDNENSTNSLSYVQKVDKSNISTMEYDGLILTFSDLDDDIENESQLTPDFHEDILLCDDLVTPIHSPLNTTSSDNDDDDDSLELIIQNKLNILEENDISSAISTDQQQKQNINNLQQHKEAEEIHQNKEYQQHREELKKEQHQQLSYKNDQQQEENDDGKQQQLERDQENHNEQSKSKESKQFTSEHSIVVVHVENKEISTNTLNMSSNTSESMVTSSNDDVEIDEKHLNITNTMNVKNVDDDDTTTTIDDDDDDFEDGIKVTINARPSINMKLVSADELTRLNQVVNNASNNIYSMNSYYTNTSQVLNTPSTPTTANDVNASVETSDDLAIKTELDALVAQSINPKTSKCITVKFQNQVILIPTTTPISSRLASLFWPYPKAYVETRLPSQEEFDKNLEECRKSNRLWRNVYPNGIDISETIGIFAAKYKKNVISLDVAYNGYAKFPMKTTMTSTSSVSSQQQHQQQQQQQFIYTTSNSTDITTSTTSTIPIMNETSDGLTKLYSYNTTFHQHTHNNNTWPDEGFKQCLSGVYQYCDFALIIVKNGMIIDYAIHGYRSNIAECINRHNPVKIFYNANEGDALDVFMHYPYQPFYHCMHDRMQAIKIYRLPENFNPISFCERSDIYCALCSALKDLRGLMFQVPRQKIIIDPDTTLSNTNVNGGLVGNHTVGNMNFSLMSSPMANSYNYQAHHYYSHPKNNTTFANVPLLTPTAVSNVSTTNLAATTTMDTNTTGIVTSNNNMMIGSPIETIITTSSSNTPMINTQLLDMNKTKIMERNSYQLRPRRYNPYLYYTNEHVMKPIKRTTNVNKIKYNTNLNTNNIENLSKSRISTPPLPLSSSITAINEQHGDDDVKLKNSTSLTSLSNTHVDNDDHDMNSSNDNNSMGSSNSLTQRIRSNNKRCRKRSKNRHYHKRSKYDNNNINTSNITTAVVATATTDNNTTTTTTSNNNKNRNRRRRHNNSKKTNIITTRSNNRSNNNKTNTNNQRQKNKNDLNPNGIHLYTRSYSKRHNLNFREQQLNENDRNSLSSSSTSSLNRLRSAYRTPKHDNDEYTHNHDTDNDVESRRHNERTHNDRMDNNDRHAISKNIRTITRTNVRKWNLGKNQYGQPTHNANRLRLKKAEKTPSRYKTYVRNKDHN